MILLNITYFKICSKTCLNRNKTIIQSTLSSSKLILLTINENPQNEAVVNSKIL